MKPTLSGRRPAYTLVELLVAIGLLIIIIALTTAIANSGAFGSQRVVSAADRVSGWLLIAKNRAVRDNAPRGLRFMITPSTSTFQTRVGHVQEMMYIEQPEIWVPNPGQESNSGSNQMSLVAFATVTVPSPAPPMPPGLVAGAVVEQWAYFITNNQDTINDFDSRVNPGDFLILPDTGVPYRITHLLHPTNPALSNPANPTIASTPIVYRPLIVDALGPTNLLGANPSAAPFIRQILLAPSTGIGVQHSYRGFALPAPFSQYQTWERPEPDFGASGLDLNQQPSISGVPNVRRASKLFYNFGFQSAPRPLLGEPILTLTASTIVDVRQPLPPGPAYPGTALGYRDLLQPASANGNAAPYWPTTSIGINIQTDPLGQQYFDVIFGPSGQIVNNPAGMIALWVRDPDKVNHPRLGDAPASNQLPTPANWSAGLPSQLDRLLEFDAAGEQVLVVVYTKTGMIATHPIVPPQPAGGNPDPYKFAKDGANSGL